MNWTIYRLYLPRATCKIQAFPPNFLVMKVSVRQFQNCPFTENIITRELAGKVCILGDVL